MKVVFAAPSKVYKQNRIAPQQRIEGAGYDLGMPMGLTKTKTGGVATWFAGHPHPRKTFVYEGVTEPNNKAKRITLSLFMPFASLRYGLKAFLNSYLYNYTRLVDSFYEDCDQTPYLHYEYYSEFAKSLWDFIYLILKRIGIESDTAFRMSMQVTTMIEYDDAYKVRLQDILTECNYEDLLNNPRKEILRLIEIYKSREFNLKNDVGGKEVGSRIINMAKMLTLLLYLPPIKKAFIFALKNINFEWFKYDEWDKYWALPRGDYNTLGKTYQERREIQADFMLEYAKKMNPNKQVLKVYEPDGSIKIKTIDYAEI